MENAKLSLQVEGISCTGCAMDMETVLRNTSGILKATVSYTTGLIDIEYTLMKLTGSKSLQSSENGVLNKNFDLTD